MSLTKSPAMTFLFQEGAKRLDGRRELEWRRKMLFSYQNLPLCFLAQNEREPASILRLLWVYRRQSWPIYPHDLGKSGKILEVGSWAVTAMGVGVGTQESERSKSVVFSTSTH
jgi:hypothetical protein